MTYYFPDLIIIVLLLLILALIFVVLHKVRRIHIAAFDTQTEIKKLAGEPMLNLYRQIQMYDALEQELDLPTPLPPLRGWAASPDFLYIVWRAIRRAAPQIVVECSSGASTVVIARALQAQGVGHLYSLENDPSYGAQTRQRLEDNGLQDWATVINAPLMECSLSGEDWPWYDITGLSLDTIDFLVIDGPPMPMHKCIRYPAGPLLFPKLSPGASVYLDDASRDDETEIVARWMSEFPDLVREAHEAEKGCVSLHKPD